MSRRDEADRRPFASRCSSPAGGSPASVSAGAPSSRPQASGENPLAQAGCQKPLRREPVRGPQPYVKPAASTQLQPESRAAHFTAKATPPAPQSGVARAGGLGGVRGAARGHGAERNTRDPSERPSSRPSGSYKPTLKASRAQRESEGTIVVASLATKNGAISTHILHFLARVLVIQDGKGLLTERLSSQTRFCPFTRAPCAAVFTDILAFCARVLVTRCARNGEPDSETVLRHLLVGRARSGSRRSRASRVPKDRSLPS
jgi:hypothetical protein